MRHIVVAEIVANVAAVSAAVGDRVDPTDSIVLLESMKMEIPVPADVTGVITEIAVRPGEVIREGDVIAVIETE